MPGCQKVRLPGKERSMEITRAATSTPQPHSLGASRNASYSSSKPDNAFVRGGSQNCLNLAVINTPLVGTRNEPIHRWKRPLMKPVTRLMCPADFRQWCHGYVVTSHEAQGPDGRPCHREQRPNVLPQKEPTRGATAASSPLRTYCRQGALEFIHPHEEDA
jgi:hypothetical protein